MAAAIVVQFHSIDNAVVFYGGAEYFQTIVIGNVDLLEVDVGSPQGRGMNWLRCACPGFPLSGKRDEPAGGYPEYLRYSIDSFQRWERLVCFDRGHRGITQPRGLGQFLQSQVPFTPKSPHYAKIILVRHYKTFSSQRPRVLSFS